MPLFPLPTGHRVPVGIGQPTGSQWGSLRLGGRWERGRPSRYRKDTVMKKTLVTLLVMFVFVAPQLGYFFDPLCRPFCG